MAVNSVSTKQRYTNYHRCPICNGHENLPQGKSIRCAGFLSQDGKYAYCTREEKAGSLDLNYDVTPAAYLHKLHGRCNCGVQHAPELSIVPPSNKKASAMRKNDSSAFGYDDHRAVARYPYYDEQGQLLFTAVRYEWADEDNPKGHSKTVRQFHQEKGKWVPGITDIRRVPYRLQELLKAPPDAIVYIPEGENKVDALRRLGLVATCNPMGAKKWNKEYSASLKGRHVVILPDNDADGRAHAEQVAASLQGIAASVRTITLPDLPEKGDIIDWLANGGTRDKLGSRHFYPPKSPLRETLLWRFK